MISDSNEVEEIIGETGEKNFDMRPEMRGNHQMTGMERAFDHRARTFHQRAGSADRPVSSFIFFRNGSASNRSLHGFID